MVDISQTILLNSHLLLILFIKRNLDRLDQLKLSKFRQRTFLVLFCLALNTIIFGIVYKDRTIHPLCYINCLFFDCFGLNIGLRRAKLLILEEFSWNAIVLIFWHRSVFTFQVASSSWSWITRIFVIAWWWNILLDLFDVQILAFLAILVSESFINISCQVQIDIGRIWSITCLTRTHVSVAYSITFVLVVSSLHLFIWAYKLFQLCWLLRWNSKHLLSN